MGWWPIRPEAKDSVRTVTKQILIEILPWRDSVDLPSLALGQESAGESFYMLFRAIKHQVDKGPVDAVTGKAKYTLNDNRLLREDVEYRTLVRTRV